MRRCTECGSTEVKEFLTGRGTVSLTYQGGTVIAVELEDYDANVIEYVCLNCGSGSIQEE